MGQEKSSLQGLPGADALEETDQIVGYMIDMRGVTALQFPILAEDLARAFRNDQNGGHAHRMRYREVAGEVLEHCSLGGVDIMHPEKAVIDRGRRLGLEF